MLLALAALCTAFSISQPVHAAPSADDVSLGFTASTRQFNTTRTAFSLNCGFMSGSTPCPTAPSCYRYFRQGYGTSGDACCTLNYICREDGTVDQALEADTIVEAAKDTGIEQAFSPPSDRTEAYWGYISTTDRSPNAGRTLSAPARLDACLHYSNVDLQTNWANCYNDCDNSTKNGYCTTTGTNDGVTQTNYVCKDRCDCVWAAGTCENF